MDSTHGAMCADGWAEVVTAAFRSCCANVGDLVGSDHPSFWLYPRQKKSHLLPFLACQRQREVCKS